MPGIWVYAADIGIYPVLSDKTSGFIQARILSLWLVLFNLGYGCLIPDNPCYCTWLARHYLENRLSHVSYFELL